MAMNRLGEATVPFSNVDHIRVWDVDSGADSLELYDVLERIKNTLDSSPKYDFINLSLGPLLPIEDDDVHTWTAVLDEYLADGACVATVAVGNDGEGDPDQGLNRVQVPSDIRATLCYSTEIDSAHPGNYTRSGLEVFFRPHSERYEENASYPKTETFFSQSKLYDRTEESLRRDAHKWETCLHGTVKKLAKSYHEPVFDIHYVARDEGHVEHQSPKIKYALVITIEAPKHANLYDMIVRKYRNILEPMLPVQVPVAIQT